MNILVVKLSSLGDIVLATPALQALRDRWPAARITVAVNREFVPVVAACPAVDDMLVRERTARVRRLKTFGQAAWAGLVNRGRFDLAIDLQGNVHSTIWTTLVGGRRKAGLGPGRRGWEFCIPLDQASHAVDLCGRVVERLGAPLRDRLPRLTVPAAAEQETEAFLAGRGLPASGFLVVHPWTAWASKEWPLDRYAEMLRGLLAHHRGPRAVVITGTAAEATRAEALVHHVADPRVVSVAGGLPLAACLALWSRAAAFVGGDTGPMHASAALGVPVVALFGPTLPEVTGPINAGERGPGHEATGHRVIQARRPPTHEAYRTPDGHAFMLAIPVEQVRTAVLEVLEARTGRVAA
jgi:heptosyltransferase-1